MDGGIGIGGLNIEREEFSDSKFDLFAKTEYEVGVKKCIFKTFRPLTTSSSHGPFSFLIPSDPEKFTNVESLRLHGRMHIMKRTPTTGVLYKLSPVNDVFNSLWASVNTKLNECEISDPSSKWYAYKAYFENHLSYSSSSKSNILSFKRYVADTAEKLDDVGDSGTPTQSTNG